MKASLKYLVIILAVLGLAGCSLPNPIQTGFSDSGVVIPGAWSSATQAAPARQGWLADFDAPVLVDLVTEAVATNYDLQAAAARVEQSRARARIVGAALRPQVDVGAGASRADLSGSGGANVIADRF